MRRPRLRSSFRRPLRGVAMLALSLLALASGAASPAAAADSRAPHGARDDWLPNSEWVMSSWLPYDEVRMHRLLKTDRGELDRWLDNRRTLGALAAKRGWPSARALAKELVRTREVRGVRRDVLERRALITLTQAHLGRHILFHIFHTAAIPEHAQELFGVSPQTFRAARAAGRYKADIAAEGGRTFAQLRAALDALLARRAVEARRTGATSVRQSKHLLAMQRGFLDFYLHAPFRSAANQAELTGSEHPH